MRLVDYLETIRPPSSPPRTDGGASLPKDPYNKARENAGRTKKNRGGDRIASPGLRSVVETIEQRMILPIDEYHRLLFDAGRLKLHDIAS